MIAKKIIQVYGKSNAIEQIENNGGIGISVKFLTIEETSFLRVVMSSIIEENTYSHLLKQEQKIELLNKLKTSVLYESIS